MAHRDGTPSGGRPKGRLNDKTIAVQRFCRTICEDPDYQAAILARARSNKLGAMEPVIWAYAYGKPKESVDVRLGRLDSDLSSLSLEELMSRMATLTNRAKSAGLLNVVDRTSDDDSLLTLNEVPRAETS